jgi:hypothetical protein
LSRPGWTGRVRQRTVRLVPGAGIHRGAAGADRDPARPGIAGGTLGRWIAGVGIAGATVQVIGLSRWVLLISGVSDDATVPALAADGPTHVWFPHPRARQPHQHGTSGCSEQPDVPPHLPKADICFHGYFKFGKAQY